jgi:two-component system NtrC family sensor kinase
VLCNRNELQQVLINLMVNAIQAMPDGGVLTLAAEDWDEADMPVGLRLVVTDSGPGIRRQADRERLFKPFFTAGKPGGTGLGLWVSQSLVERYGGRITVDSEAAVHDLPFGCVLNPCLKQMSQSPLCA